MSLLPITGFYFNRFHLRCYSVRYGVLQSRGGWHVASI
jgi:hypothetical protein